MSLATTYLLLKPDAAEFAIDELPLLNSPDIVDGLAECVIRAGAAKTRIRALRKLALISVEACRLLVPFALSDAANSLRAAMIDIVASHPALRDEFIDLIKERLQLDPSWTNRNAALRVLVDAGSFKSIFIAADDPYWRVRNTLLEAILQSDWQKPSVREALADKLSVSLKPDRVSGLLHVLEFLWNSTEQWEPARGAEPICPFWDWDSAVLARRVEAMSNDQRRDNIAFFPELLLHSESRIRKVAAASIQRYADSCVLLQVVDLLADPRTGIDEEVSQLLNSIDSDRIQPVAELVLQDHAKHDRLRRWASRTLANLEGAKQSSQPSKGHLSYPSYDRASGLSIARANELVAEPLLESSWHVLSTAATMCRIPLWKLAEKATQLSVREQQLLVANAKPAAQVSAEELRISLPDVLESSIYKPLGPQNILVSRIGLSGHYGLPAEGYAEGVEAGVNLFFWEPNYDTLTSFAKLIPKSTKLCLHFIAGTFESEVDRVRRDVERALRNLRIESLSLFLIFWVRSSERIDEALLRLLDDLQREGKTRMVGLSTHDRSLAIQAIRDRWNPVMVRHSAVHPKAEQEVFPIAQEHKTSLITFSSTCYGRLIRAILPAGLSAADCYRYSVMQPSVTTCLAAPSTLEQLRENLTALQNPTLTAEQLEKIRSIGAVLRERETLVRELIRNR